MDKTLFATKNTETEGIKVLTVSLLFMKLEGEDEEYTTTVSHYWQMTLICQSCPRSGWWLAARG